MTNPFTGIIFMQFLWKDLTILEFLALIYKFKKKLVKFHINTCTQVMTYTRFGWIRIQIVKKKNLHVHLGKMTTSENCNFVSMHAIYNFIYLGLNIVYKSFMIFSVVFGVLFKFISRNVLFLYNYCFFIFFLIFLLLLLY